MPIDEVLGRRDLRLSDVTLGVASAVAVLMSSALGLTLAGAESPAVDDESAPPLVAVAIGVAPDRPPLAAGTPMAPAAPAPPSTTTPPSPRPDAPVRPNASPRTTRRAIPASSPGPTIPAIDPPPGTPVGPPADPGAPPSPGASEDGAPGGGEPNAGIPEAILRSYRDRLTRWFSSRFRVSGSGLDTAELVKLRAKAVVSVADDGTVASYSLGESGNEAFDAAARRALEATIGEPVPPPPESYPAALPPRLHITFVCKPTTCD